MERVDLGHPRPVEEGIAAADRRRVEIEERVEKARIGTVVSIGTPHKMQMIVGPG